LNEISSKELNPLRAKRDPNYCTFKNKPEYVSKSIKLAN